MSKIMINDDEIIEGTFSFEVTIDESGHPPIYSITGVLSSSGKYIEELNSLQNERYRLERIRVYRESFGSEVNEVIYFFTAGKYGIDKSFHVESEVKEE